MRSPPSDFTGWPALGEIKLLGFEPDKFLAFRLNQTSGEVIGEIINWFFESLYDLGEDVSLAGQVAARAPDGTPPDGPQPPQTQTA